MMFTKMTLPAQVFAAIAALCFALSNITIKRGYGDTSVLAGLIVSLCTGILLTGAIVVSDPPGSVSLAGVVAFGLAGVLSPTLGRAANAVGIDRLGAAVSVPLHASAYPIAASVVAFLLLGQSIRPLQLVGLAVVVTAIWLLARRPTDVAAPGHVARSIRASGKVPAVLFPLAAGTCYGLSDVAQSRGVEELADPVFGAMIGLVVGFAIWTTAAFSISTLRSDLRLGSRGVWWFVLTGLLTAGATISIIEALRVGQVVVVSSIVGTQPVLVVVFSALFLRRFEHFGPRVVVGALAAMVGTILVSA